MREFAFGYFYFVNIFARDADSINPAHHFALPVVKVLFPFLLSHKILKLHNLKLPRAEQKVAWRDFVSERLANLRDAEWELRMERVNYVLEIDEHALRGFGTKVRRGCRVFHGTDMCFEHHVELPSFAKFAAAFGTEVRPLFRFEV